MKIVLPFAAFIGLALLITSCVGSHQALCECACEQTTVNQAGESITSSDTITFNPMGMPCDEYIGIPCESEHSPKGEITSATLGVVPAQ
jgi:hypothetical protein